MVFSVASSIYNAPSIYESGQGGGASSTIGGREYKTVTINGVTWLAENLDFKFCIIGGSGTPSTPNAWYYNNDEATYGIDGIRKCGLLYNWYAVHLLNDNKSELIPGWHVPTKDEWNVLANSVGGTGVAGTRLKAINGAANGSWPTGWNGTDEFGFTVFPAGRRFSGSFFDVGGYANFWTDSESSSSNAYQCFFNAGASMGTGSSSGKDFAYSVRLVKD